MITEATLRVLWSAFHGTTDFSRQFHLPSRANWLWLPASAEIYHWCDPAQHFVGFEPLSRGGNLLLRVVTPMSRRAAAQRIRITAPQLREARSQAVARGPLTEIPSRSGPTPARIDRGSVAPLAQDTPHE